MLLSFFLKQVLYIIASLHIVNCNSDVFPKINKRTIAEGIVQIKDYMEKENGDKFKTNLDVNYNILFKDSAVIVERKMRNSHYINDTLFRSTYDIFMYTYLDLKTMNAQDYLHLDDTAIPITNYHLNDNEVVCYKFYNQIVPPSNESKYLRLKDTMIDRKLFIRFKFINTLHNLEVIFYMQCNGATNMFHLNRYLDEMLPDCQVIKSVSRNIDGSSDLRVSEFKVLKDYLDKDEKLIFAKWKQNSLRTKLPLLQFQDALKIGMTSSKDSISEVELRSNKQ